MAKAIEAVEQPALPSARHDARDVSWRFVAMGSAATISVVLLLMLLAYWLYPATTTIGLSRSEIVQPLAGVPALQSNPRADFERFHKQEMAALQSSGWIDRTHGVVHIPIDRAMRALAAKGISGWPRQ